jgi:hypothetical protein
MGWYKNWSQKVYDERVLLKRPDGNYDFVFNGKFIWPYIVTADQKDLIDRRLIIFSAYAAGLAALVIVAVLVAVGYLQPTGLRGLLGFLLLLLVATELQILMVWPLIWVRIRLPKAPRHTKPFRMSPLYPTKYDFSALVSQAPDLSLWAGMVISFGLDAVIGVLVVRDFIDGTFEKDWGPSVGALLLFSTMGLICLLQWWGRPKNRASAWTGNSIDLGIIKISRSKAVEPPRSNPTSSEP